MKTEDISALKGDLLLAAHAAMEKGLTKPGLDILRELTSGQADLWHMATGVAGEAGELVDAVKRVAIYRKEIDIPNVIEELGDLEYYLAGVRRCLHIDREDTLRHNMVKLGTRYPGFTYTDKAAADRADKQEPVVTEGPKSMGALHEFLTSLVSKGFTEFPVGRELQLRERVEKDHLWSWVSFQWRRPWGVTLSLPPDPPLTEDFHWKFTPLVNKNLTRTWDYVSKTYCDFRVVDVDKQGES